MAPSFRANIVKTLLAMLLLVAIIAGSAFLVHHWLAPSKAIRSPQPTPVVKQERLPSKTTPPVYEIYTPEAKRSIPSSKKPSSLPPFTARPKVAIIFDDLGYDSRIVKKIIDLNVPLTLSVLPHSPLRHTIARGARQKGMEIMLHLPMEPMEYPGVKPGPGALLVSMSPDVLIHQLESNLNSVPEAKGVNNHMGSRMTTISTQMYQIFTILKKRHLYFIDSRTTKDSLCKPAARLLQIQFAERDVFLDHTQDPNTIRKQLKRLIQIALEKGHAIGIGHPHEATYRVLRDMLPVLAEKVTIVPVSELVYSIDTAEPPPNAG